MECLLQYNVLAIETRGALAEKTEESQASQEVYLRVKMQVDHAGARLFFSSRMFVHIRFVVASSAAVEITKVAQLFFFRRRSRIYCRVRTTLVAFSSSDNSRMTPTLVAAAAAADDELSD